MAKLLQKEPVKIVTAHIATSDHRAEAVDDSIADFRLRVTVVFTTAEATVCALRTAAVFAESLAAWIAVVAVEAVPYRLPLDQPPVAVAFLERLMLSLVSKAAIETDEVSLEICMCRDRKQCLRHILRPRSLVVIGGRNGRWSRERKLEHWLNSLGHHVVFVDAGARSSGDALPHSHQQLLRSLWKQPGYASGRTRVRTLGDPRTRQ